MSNPMLMCYDALQLREQKHRITHNMHTNVSWESEVHLILVSFMPNLLMNHFACISCACSGAMSHVKYPPAVGIAMFPKVWQLQMVKDGQSNALSTNHSKFYLLHLEEKCASFQRPDCYKLRGNKLEGPVRQIEKSIHMHVFANEKSNKTTTGQNSFIAKVHIKITPLRRNVFLP